MTVYNKVSRAAAAVVLMVAFMTLAAGCGSLRRTTMHSIPASQPHTSVAEQRHERAPRRVESAERAERQANSRYESQQPVAIQPRAPRPDMHFSGAQTEHVRLASINYFPTGGIDLSLCAMAAEFCYPLRGRLISDYGMRSGRMHTGIDLKAALGDTIRAAFAGVVRMAKNYSSYGNVVVIRHYEGFETLYSHNSRNLVRANDRVEAGDPIALAGRTGRATTEHLHFEVRAGGEHLDPKLLVDPVAMTLRTGNLLIRNRNGVIVASATEAGAAAAGAEMLAARADADAARAEALAASLADAEKAAAVHEPVYYRVVRGDTLSHIARRNGTTVARLCELNGLTTSSILQLNQRLRIR
ncbi:MAG: M23 family metallopeptidase [Rikenellaceae bacterium]|nr:M23 family metallopeptidase [Rikenellaceae bacterium]MCL2692321.1 M23 family metallopeptidase [Rikenellaceae bacterium]